jgi:hypothetical protein
LWYRYRSQPPLCGTGKRPNAALVPISSKFDREFLQSDALSGQTVTHTRMFFAKIEVLK